jgi:hypothetical protein
LSDGASPDAELFLFETTHHALWAEDVARERELPAEVVPAPAAAKAKCGLALQTLPHLRSALAEALDGEGIAFRLYP